jgi:hypothetical protein
MRNEDESQFPGQRGVNASLMWAYRKFPRMQVTRGLICHDPRRYGRTSMYPLTFWLSVIRRIKEDYPDYKGFSKDRAKRLVNKMWKEFSTRKQEPRSPKIDVRDTTHQN